jgi:hypothetical protein
MPNLKHRAKKIDERCRGRCLSARARLSLHAIEYRDRAEGRSINRYHSIMGEGKCDSTAVEDRSEVDWRSNSANPRQPRIVFGIAE